MRLTQINQRQHHHDECLQQHNQNVEEPPAKPGHNLPKHAQGAAQQTEAEGITTKKRNQEEEQLASIHVSEQSHAQGNALGEIFDNVQSEIERPEQRIRTERSGHQPLEEAADTVRLEAVVNHQNQNADRDAERAVQVRGSQRTHMFKTKPASDHRDQIDREKVDAVHQRDPDEEGS